MRDQSKKVLADALTEGGTSGNEPVSPATAAEALEAEILAIHPDEKTKDYRMKLRAVQQMVKGPRNAQLRKAILHGAISATDVARLDAKTLEQMANDAVLPPSAPTPKAANVLPHLESISVPASPALSAAERRPMPGLHALTSLDGEPAPAGHPQPFAAGPSPVTAPVVAPKASATSPLQSSLLSEPPPANEGNRVINPLAQLGGALTRQLSPGSRRKSQNCDAGTAVVEDSVDPEDVSPSRRRPAPLQMDVTLSQMSPPQITTSAVKAPSTVHSPVLGVLPQIPSRPQSARLNAPTPCQTQSPEKGSADRAQVLEMVRAARMAARSRRTTSGSSAAPKLPGAPASDIAVGAYVEEVKILTTKLDQASERERGLLSQIDRLNADHAAAAIHEPETATVDTTASLAPVGENPEITELRAKLVATESLAHEARSLTAKLEQAGMREQELIGHIERLEADKVAAQEVETKRISEMSNNITNMSDTSDLNNLQRRLVEAESVSGERLCKVNMLQGELGNLRAEHEDTKRGLAEAIRCRGEISVERNRLATEMEEFQLQDFSEVDSLKKIIEDTSLRQRLLEDERDVLSRRLAEGEAAKSDIAKEARATNAKIVAALERERQNLQTYESQAQNLQEQREEMLLCKQQQETLQATVRRLELELEVFRKNRRTKAAELLERSVAAFALDRQSNAAGWQIISEAPIRAASPDGNGDHHSAVGRGRGGCAELFDDIPVGAPRDFATGPSSASHGADGLPPAEVRKSFLTAATVAPSPESHLFDTTDDFASVLNQGVPASDSVTDATGQRTGVCMVVGEHQGASMPVAVEFCAGPLGQNKEGSHGVQNLMDEPGVRIDDGNKTGEFAPGGVAAPAAPGPSHDSSTNARATGVTTGNASSVSAGVADLFGDCPAGVPAATEPGVSDLFGSPPSGVSATFEAHLPKPPHEAPTCVSGLFIETNADYVFGADSNVGFEFGSRPDDQVGVCVLSAAQGASMGEAVSSAPCRPASEETGAGCQGTGAALVSDTGAVASAIPAVGDPVASMFGGVSDLFDEEPMQASGSANDFFGCGPNRGFDNAGPAPCVAATTVPASEQPYSQNPVMASFGTDAYQSQPGSEQDPIMSNFGKVGQGQLNVDTSSNLMASFGGHAQQDRQAADMSSSLMASFGEHTQEDNILASFGEAVQERSPPKDDVFVNSGDNISNSFGKFLQPSPQTAAPFASPTAAPPTGPRARDVSLLF